MKTIGIKLADGSFYPIMQEGSAEKKQLSLTTVKDNQTTVQVDLYRSESATMEDAEYVDTLEIKNLIKHPNGEPDISLDLSLDENNELKAELHDPETGKDSTTSVDLVSRTLEQRNEPSDVTLAETDILGDETVADLDFDAESFDLDESLSSSVPQETFDGDDDLTFDPNSLNVDSIVEEETPAETSEFEETSENESEDNSAATTAAVAGVGLLGAAAAIAVANKDKDEETISSEEEFATDDTVVAEDDFSLDIDEPVSEETSSESDFSLDDLSIPDDFDSSDNTEFTSESETVDSATESGSGDDFSLDIDEPVSEETSSESDFSLDDLSIPDDFDSSDNTEITSESETVDSATESGSGDDFSLDIDEPVSEETSSESDFSLDDLSIPDDFDSSDNTEITSESEFSSNNFADDESFASDLDFDFPETETTEETSESTSDEFDESGNAGLDFSDILDEETREGHAGLSSDTAACHKKAKAPVIICIICAIICILAVILILFIIPSSVNLLSKNKKDSTPVQQTVSQPETPVETTVEEPKYEAKENEIVVAPAEAVVPEVQKQKAPEGKNITYKIKWGDTLWDLAKSYYNNPWKYPKIAKYNGIKNPDHIISGTTIIIPAE